MVDIKIAENSIGWLRFILEDKSFNVSYLSDFIEEMRELLDLHDDCTHDKEVHRIYLDGEGNDLYLTAWREYRTLYVVWENYNEEDKADLKIMQFNYNDFMKEFNDKFETIKKNYYSLFDIDENKYNN